MTLSSQPVSVPASWSEVPHWWNWKRSANVRRASLAGTAFIVLFPALLGPFFLPVALVRGGAGLLQTLLNRNLSLSSPLDPRSPVDWLFLAGFMAAGLAAYWVPSMGGSVLGAEMLFAPALICYVVFQHRAVGLSFAAAERDVQRELRIRRRLWAGDELRPGAMADAALRAA